MENNHIQWDSHYMLGTVAHKKLCFIDKRANSPTEIMCMICSFLTIVQVYIVTQMEQSVETVKRVALYFHQQLQEEEYPRSLENTFDWKQVCFCLPQLSACVLNARPCNVPHRFTVLKYFVASRLWL